MLAQLILEQAADAKSRHVSKDGRECAIAPRKLSILAKCGRRKISWGLPAQCAECQIDRCCPRCGARSTQVSYGNSRVSSERTRLNAGIEIFDNGALCACGWSYDNS